MKVSKVPALVRGSVRLMCADTPLHTLSSDCLNCRCIFVFRSKWSVESVCVLYQSQRSRHSATCKPVKTSTLLIN